MGDSADVFRALAERNRERKRIRRDREAERIETYEIQPGVHVRWLNHYHVRIRAPNGRSADYWPSTGRWMPTRSRGRTRHGDLGDVKRWLEGGDAT